MFHLRVGFVYSFKQLLSELAVRLRFSGTVTSAVARKSAFPHFRCCSRIKFTLRIFQSPEKYRMDYVRGEMLHPVCKIHPFQQSVSCPQGKSDLKYLDHWLSPAPRFLRNFFSTPRVSQGKGGFWIVLSLPMTC